MAVVAVAVAAAAAAVQAVAAVVAVAMAGGSLGGMQQPTGSEAATAIPMLFGADVMKEGGEEEAGASEGEESDEGGDEGSSLGKGVANTPSWLHECFESPEAEQEYWVSRSGRICSGRSSEG